ncbi:hypothetical protein J437_LFUL001525 [Ladona fulva]|uniref:Zinc finger CHCC-type domain-containing protein n=1 Tax=Ladona fulva TaxID=123851 RepID=A0A8K0NXC5_LADFU|nr:hypothetical protein J437_LFUL001525 [Ladona fulva]
MVVMAGIGSARNPIILKNLLKFQCRVFAVKNYSSASKGGSLEVADPKTHTGQSWDKNDYRLVRFIDRPKQINSQFAIDLINSVPPQSRKEKVVWCDGGGGPTGHPKVYINLDKPGNHTCGYCGLRFTKEGKH